MVKYLGIDYLQTALSKRRTFLTQTLLTIPQHLAHVANYPHNGILQDDTYRTLWIQESFDRNFLAQQMEKVSVDLHELVKSVAEVKLEKYEQETLLQGISFDLYDIIPSSSSESPDMPCKSVGSGLSVTANFEEVFETYIFKDHKLEEVITSDYLADTMKKLPSLKRLLSCFVPSPVCDPLLLKAQKPTELCMFRDVDELHLELTMGTSSCSTFQEEFEKLKYIENDYRHMELEEILSPFVRNSHLKDVTKEAGKQVLQQAATYTEVEKLGSKNLSFLELTSVHTWEEQGCNLNPLHMLPPCKKVISHQKEFSEKLSPKAKTKNTESLDGWPILLAGPGLQSLKLHYAIFG